AEARNGYSMLSMAQSILRGDSPITDAEARLRRAADLSEPPPDRGGTASLLGAISLSTPLGRPRRVHAVLGRLPLVDGPPRTVRQHACSDRDRIGTGAEPDAARPGGAPAGPPPYLPAPDAARFASHRPRRGATSPRAVARQFPGLGRTYGVGHLTR